MAPFEYLLLFTAIILGLAASDLAISLHRLLNGAARMHWGLLAPLAALVAFLKIVTQWWTWRRAEALAAGFTFEMFLTLLAAVVVLFLLAACALPDEPGDLDAHYASVRRRYWSLFLAHWVLGTGLSIWAQVQIQGAHVALLSPAYLVFPVAVSLILIRHRIWHGLCLAGFAGLYVAQFWGQTLT